MINNIILKNAIIINHDLMQVGMIFMCIVVEVNHLS